MNINQSAISRRSFVAAVSSCLGVSAMGQPLDTVFPSKPLRMIVGYAPGGAADTLARLLANKSNERFGQTTIVDNKPGAGGLLAAEVTANSIADGHTFFLSDDAQLAIAPGIGEPKAVAMKRLLSPIVGLTTIPMVLVVQENSPATTLKELVALAKAKPGALNYASAGNGNIAHVSGELFKNLSKTFITHVPYRGGTPALASVLSGETQMAFVTVPTALSYIKSGKVRALGVANLKRSQALPAVPTCIEAGLNGMVAVSWHGIVVPKATPTAAMTRLAEGFMEILKSGDVTARLRDMGYEITPRNGKEFADWIQGETEKWQKLAKVANIKPEA
ncbi:tripartite tricarboxylate transporter substrate-binding protein [Polaromonas sp.]|uniref:Bug family tripartite tricarboxylate transporter substrate binding protein n=1 Tax=Polaromonas sp. TaxID=1869339 RepID=UPI003262E42E